jgi:hypothetical protein
MRLILLSVMYLLPKIVVQYIKKMVTYLSKTYSQTLGRIVWMNLMCGRAGDDAIGVIGYLKGHREGEA